MIKAKRFFSSILLLSVLFMAGTAVGENTLAFEGLWRDPDFQNISVLILSASATETDGDAGTDTLVISMHLGRSADEVETSRMVATVSGNTATYSGALRSLVHLGKDGQMEQSELLTDTGKGTFTLSDPKTIIWTDADVSLAGTLQLHPEHPSVPAAADLADHILRPIASVESGTAGATLKQAMLAKEIIRYCCSHLFCVMDKESLYSAFMDAFNDLSEDEKAAFAENEPVVADMIRTLSLGDAESHAIMSDIELGEEYLRWQGDSVILSTTNVLLTGLNQLSDRNE